MTGRCFIGYIWLTESMRIEDTTKSTSIMFVFDSFSILFASLYFKYVLKDWTYFYAVPAVLILFATIGLCFMQESPKFYFGKK